MLSYEEMKTIKKDDYDGLCPTCGGDLEPENFEYDENSLDGYFYSSHYCQECGRKVYDVEYSLRLERIICVEDESPEHPSEQ